MANTLATEKQADAIKYRMQEIRTQLPYNVDVARQSARQLADWKYHMSRYPWALIGVTTLAGFLIVPKRHRPNVVVVSRNSDKGYTDATMKPAKRGLIGGIGGAIATLIMKQASVMVTKAISERLSASAPSRPVNQPR